MQREFRITEFEPPTRIRWSETSKNAVTAPEGGYDLEPAGDGKTQVSFHNVLEPATASRASSSRASPCARRARAPTTSRSRSSDAVEGETARPA